MIVRCIVCIALFCSMLIPLLTGCGSSFFKGAGKYTVKEEQMIPLPLGSFSDFWETHNLTLFYEGTRVDNHLKISGSIQLTGGLQHFSVVQFFYLKSWFMDGKGMLLSGKTLFMAGHMSSIKMWNFQQEFELPKETAAIAFSYSGEAIDGAGRDAISFSFWMEPFE